MNNETSSSQMGIVVGGFSALLVAVIGAGAYFGNFDGVNAKTLEAEYLKKSDVSFYDLPEEEQGRYITKFKCDSKATSTTSTESCSTYQERIASLEASLKKVENEAAKPATTPNTAPTEELDALKTRYSALQTQYQTLLAQQQSAPKPEMVKQPQPTKAQAVFDKTKQSPIATFQCKDGAPGEYYLTPACKSELKTFLADTITQPVVFEVIGVLDEEEYRVLEENEFDPKTTQYTRNLLDAGLAHLRAKEAAWYIDQHFKKPHFTIPANYNLHTTKNRGIVIRAFAL